MCTIIIPSIALMVWMAVSVCLWRLTRSIWYSVVIFIAEGLSWFMYQPSYNEWVMERFRIFIIMAVSQTLTLVAPVVVLVALVHMKVVGSVKRRTNTPAGK